MKIYKPENPKSFRISTYLTADEVADLSKVVGDETTASWLRNLVLNAIYGGGNEDNIHNA